MVLKSILLAACDMIWSDMTAAAAVAPSCRMVLSCHSSARAVEDVAAAPAVSCIWVLRITLARSARWVHTRACC